MYLFYGMLCIAVAALVFGATLIGSRRPDPPRWASDLMVGNIFAPLVVGLMALGTCSLIQFLFRLASTPPTIGEWIATAATLGVTLVVFKLMRVRQRLADYSAAAAGSQVIRPAFPASPEAGKPEPPVKPQSGHRKAA
jgi:hypothetical protein